MFSPQIRGEIKGKLSKLKTRFLTQFFIKIDKNLGFFGVSVSTYLILSPKLFKQVRISNPFFYPLMYKRSKNSIWV